MTRIGRTSLLLALILVLLSPVGGAAQNDETVHQFFLPGSSTVGWRVHSSGSLMMLSIPTGALLTSRTFAQLSTVLYAGAIVYCSNCTKATPCASGGTGAIAKYLNNAWDCN